MKKVPNRIAHPYWLWEETRFNMWGQVANRSLFLETAINFTGNPDLYGKWMQEVTVQWPYSCEHNLTLVEQNRKAWLGHAACALAFRCPEDVVRQAWGYLSEKQQELANLQAQKNIEEWEKRYA